MKKALFVGKPLLLAGVVVISAFSARGAVVLTGEGTTARLDALVEGSMVTDQGDVISASVTAPMTVVAGQDFAASGSTGAVTMTRDGSPPAEDRSVSLTAAFSVVQFTLQPGETLNYSFRLDYSVVNGGDAGLPEVGWSLTNTTLGSVYFTGSGNSMNATINEAGSITAMMAETIKLEVEATLNDIVVPPNNSASASWSDYEFIGDSNIPEPSTGLLALLGTALLAVRRKR